MKLSLRQVCNKMLELSKEIGFDASIPSDELIYLRYLQSNKAAHIRVSSLHFAPVNNPENYFDLEGPNSFYILDLNNKHLLQINTCNSRKFNLDDLPRDETKGFDLLDETLARRDVSPEEIKRLKTFSESMSIGQDYREPLESASTACEIEEDLPSCVPSLDEQRTEVMTLHSEKAAATAQAMKPPQLAVPVLDATKYLESFEQFEAHNRLIKLAEVSLRN